MEISNTLQSGFRRGQGNTGYQLYCRYGLPHLVCLNIDSPDDPLTNPSLTHLKASGGYFAEQFLLNIHPHLNSAEVIANLHQYATQCNAIQSDKTPNQIINELSLLVATNKLLVIPMYDL